GAAVVAVRENAGARTLGYIGAVPSAPQVDGAFDEWTALSADGSNDVTPRPNPDIDVARYGAQHGGTSTFLYTAVLDRMHLGPPLKPVGLGEDGLRIFLDIDNSTWSGYSIGGIGADRLVEIRGKDRAVTQSALLAFSGSFPGQWAWTPVSPITVALGYHAVEL